MAASYENARAHSNPASPICLDASSYTFPKRAADVRDYERELHGVVCMGVVMYLRPRQRMLLLCSTKIPGNIARVTHVLRKMLPANRRRVAVMVHDGVYKGAGAIANPDSPETIGDACLQAQLQFMTPELECVRVGYIFSRAATKAATFVQQIDELAAAVREKRVHCLGLCLPRFADFAAATRLLRTYDVRVAFIVIGKSTERMEEVLAWVAAEPRCEVLSYDHDIDVAHTTLVSATRRGYDHARLWSAVVAAQAPSPVPGTPVLRSVSASAAKW